MSQHHKIGCQFYIATLHPRIFFPYPRHTNFVFYISYTNCIFLDISRNIYILLHLWHRLFHHTEIHQLFSLLSFLPHYPCYLQYIHPEAPYIYPRSSSYPVLHYNLPQHPHKSHSLHYLLPGLYNLHTVFL